MSARVPDANGWYEINANPLSKVGVYPYKGSSIKAADPNRIYYVYRPADELSKPATLSSLRLLPWINDHTMLGDPATTGYQAPEAKGIEGVIGENVFFKDGVVYGNVKVFSVNLQRLIQSGKADLSLGYRCKYDWTPGTFNGQPYDCVQRNIIFNHLALVSTGRMGDDVAVLDSVDDAMVATFDNKDFVYMSKFNKKRVAAWVQRWSLVPGKSKVNNAVVTVATMDAADADADADTESGTEPSLSDVVAFIKEVGPQIAAITAAFQGMAGAGGAPADATGGVTTEDKKAPGAVQTPPGAVAATTDAAGAVPPAATGMDAAEVGRMVQAGIEKALAGFNTKSLLSEVSQRDALAKSLSGFVGTFDHADMTLAEVAKYGVDKLTIPHQQGAEVTAVTAWLHGRTPQHQATGMDSRETGKASSIDGYLSGK